ncbi:MAG: glucose-1-phosphate cytidylyltransferase [Candidatus Pristimantibacillus lignocellulolyticus]|uniref:Glucose-1-phosphate cytidylyltransferase n=1 Tax=Candidatus Pristimantibacillus lignocellulolyticus TaxID=2994561 RepID=A0A9J6ZGV2_9BACL|nr:MAG: glucose-1-phosphate cytidylyltransferase [Candidatus Pristimantibacillus lignocellulolyticus]
MKVVILAGGRGTRISEESHLKPKPMIEIGDIPILLHIMKTYSFYGYNEFIICLGYKGYVIKEYFANYYRHMSKAVTYDFSSGDTVEVHNNTVEPWKVTLVDTGIDTLTGSRVKRVESFIGNETFMLTYGDGLADININDLVKHHQQGSCITTMTAVQPEGRFGRLELDGNQVIGFNEKVKGDGAWINGGYMVCEPEMFSYIHSLDDSILEQGPLQQLAADGQLQVYRHNKFWQPMDTLREKIVLDELWKNNKAPWKVWRDS